MSKRIPAGPAGDTARLDNLTLARKEGWHHHVYAAPRQQPEMLSIKQLAALEPRDLAAHNRKRAVWHANLGPLRTPMLEELHEDLADILGSNQQDGDKAKGAIGVDAGPGQGKTTAALAYAKKLHQDIVLEYGAFTDDGHERWPVCRVGLTGNTGIRDFNRAMLRFYGHPGSERGSAGDFADRALDCVLACETKLIIVDDLHFLKMNEKASVEVSNHFKYIANEFPVTLLFIGMDLGARGLFSEGSSYADLVLGQSGRRTTPLTMRTFTIDTEEARYDWRNTLLAIEQRLVLANKYPGMLADVLSDYLFARSTGIIGSLITVINRGCQRAIRQGVECLDEKLLDKVKIDGAAESAFKEMMQAFASGRLTSKPGRKPTRRHRGL
ncbi:ATP-binding protein [Nocardia sp. NPDC056611]|uniref:ATP-binding protein n=1 Tax=Nocardia sp. NPDC056611 TaxID=3345877 RepID=UPI00366D0D4B